MKKFLTLFLLMSISLHAYIPNRMYVYKKQKGYSIYDSKRLLAKKLGHISRQGGAGCYEYHLRQSKGLSAKGFLNASYFNRIPQRVLVEDVDGSSLGSIYYNKGIAIHAPDERLVATTFDRRAKVGILEICDPMDYHVIATVYVPQMRYTTDPLCEVKILDQSALGAAELHPDLFSILLGWYLDKFNFYSVNISVSSSASLEQLEDQEELLLAASPTEEDFTFVGALLSQVDEEALEEIAPTLQESQKAALYYYLHPDYEVTQTP